MTTSTALASREPEIVEGEVLEPTTPAPGLFGTDNPTAVVVRATEISDELARVIRDRKLCVRIGAGEHVLVEGWTLLGSMLGVFPVTVWSRRLDDGWEARVEARTLDGRLVGAAESMCLPTERRWARADDYARRSMAQTRATGRALRQPLGFVMELAGFAATPAEEMSQDAPAEKAAKQDTGTIPPERQPTREQGERLRAVLHDLAELDPDTDWQARAFSLAGIPDWSYATATIVDLVLDGLAADLAAKELDKLAAGEEEE